MLQEIFLAISQKKQTITQQELMFFLRDIVAEIRPKNPENSDEAARAILALCFTLSQFPAYAVSLRDAVLSVIKEKRSVSLFADSGIISNRGFFSELFRRISHRILPDVMDEKYLKDTFGLIFHKRSDALWVEGVPDSVWADLFNCLKLNEAPDELKERASTQLVDAIQVLSYRLSASGLEPELIKNHEDLENYASPFITQNVELLAFLAAERPEVADINHVKVMLDQCLAVTEKVRKSCEQSGTSIELTGLIQRIKQQIARLKLLFNILIHIKHDIGQLPSELPEAHTVALKVVPLFKSLVAAECNKNNIAAHWRENMELMALRVTENAGRTGEHYIAENRAQYFALLKSAMGAGLIITCMAVIKLLITGAHLPPLSETILISLNYGLGFVLIHVLHFTVATKQPAMTAATIAATIGEGDSKIKSLDKLVKIVSQTVSSQTSAVIGNVIVIIPFAILIDMLIQYCTGHHFVTPEKAQALLQSNDPLVTGTVLYGAVAGVCLFLAGLIAGYHDNLAAFNQIPERINALPRLKKWLGAQRLQTVSDYIRDNLGALAGNFYFGCLLGVTSGLGVMLGLPLDIRHVTFVSAFFGFSLPALEFQLSHYMIAVALLSIVLVATANLFTSFFLALYVAMKSRKVRFEHWRVFTKTLLSRLNQHPNEFFLPPKE
ncbi:MAG TPA: site-specific recombinase [Methylophilus sp.]